MRRMRQLIAVAAVMWGGAFLAVSAAGQHKPPAVSGWTIPAGAPKEKNPLPAGDATVAAGKALFAKNCTRCHGTEGKGDGPDADHHHADHMNLTRAAGAAQNPDGVVFHKVWNGRTNPKMPAFKEKLTREQAWAIVAYVQTLRARK